MTHADASPVARLVSSGNQRWVAVAAEAARATRAAAIPSAVTALLTAAVCAVVLLSAGRSAAVERSLASQLDGAGARIVTVTDGTGTAGMTTAAVDRAAAVSGVSWVLGLGLAVDVRIDTLGAGGTPVAARPVNGVQPPDLELLSGRWPAAGEAIVSAAGVQQLGLSAAAGSVHSDAGKHFAVVGTFRAVGTLADLEARVLFSEVGRPDDPLPQLIVVAQRSADVPELARTLVSVSGATFGDRLRTTTPDVLLQVQGIVNGEFGRYSRQIAGLTMSAGILLIGITMLGSVNARRRDFGRRRALGASRSALVAIVITQATLPALIGATLGAVASAGTLLVTRQPLPSSAYTVSAAALVVLAAALSAAPAGLLTALRDPVRELRVP